MENGLEEREEKESKRGVGLQRNTLPLQIFALANFFFFFFPFSPFPPAALFLASVLQGWGQAIRFFLPCLDGPLAR